jgi:isopentenyl-diphosphate delta-isomerase
MNNSEYVILVDERDQELGVMEKMQAHQEGKLHRAFSVLLFNSKNELLLQRRALEKYHCGGMWTNTCCSHPRINESTVEAANRRLNEEMGLSANLELYFNFIYKAHLPNSLVEHELDYVFVGKSDNLPTINKYEVADYCYKSIDFIEQDLLMNPNKYTPWFHHIVRRFKSH